MKEKLFINDELVDLPSDTIALTSQINDIGELKDRQSNFSNSLTLPFTPTNIRIMKMLGVAGNTSKLPYQDIKVKYSFEGIELISDGFGVIKNTAKGYSFIVYSGNKNIFSDIKGLKLSDLDFTQYNHNLTLQVFKDSHANTDGYIYAIANYSGSGDDTFVLETYSPSFYIHTLFKMIFEQAGYTISGDIFSDADYKSRITTMANGSLRNVNDVNVVLDVGDQTIATGETGYKYLPELIVNGDFEANSGWYLGLGWSIQGWSLGVGRAVYDGTIGTPLEYPTIIATAGLKYKVSFDVLKNDGTGTNSANFGGVNLNSNHLAIGRHSYTITAINTNKFSIFSSGGNDMEIDNVSIQEVIDQANYEENFDIQPVTKSYLIHSYLTTTSGYYNLQGVGSITEIFGTNFTILVNKNDGTGFFEIPSAFFFNPVNVNLFTYYFDAGKLINFYVRVDSELDTGNIPMIHRIRFQNDYTLRIRTDEESVEVIIENEIGSTLQTAFIKDVMQRFGLSIDRKKNSNEYRFIQMKNLLNDKANAEDWSDKFSDFISEDYQLNYAKINNFKFIYDRNDNDVTEDFADGFFEIDNVNLKDEKQIAKTIFKASNKFQTLNDIYYPNAYFISHWEYQPPEDGQPEEFNFEVKKDGLRIFKLTNKTRNITVTTIWDGVVTEIISDSRPYLDFKEVDYQTELNNNYIEVKNILNDYKKFKGNFDLNLLDNYKLDFFRLKYLRQYGKYYYLNKVINFIPNKKTKIELIEIK